MKKAKIIVPSVSLLCFSAIACVTGSVAWFSSVTNAHIATSSFQVQALDGTMNTTVTAGVGTKVTTVGDVTTVVPDTYGEGGANTNVLSHGSFDAANLNAYTIKQFSSTTSPEYEKVNTGALTKANESDFYVLGTEGYYHVFSFDIAFKYDFGGAATGTYNLYFDVTDSKVTRSEAAPAGLDTAKGFRMAFVNTDTNDWVVWSYLQKSYYDAPTNTKPSRYIGVAGDPAALGEQTYTTGEEGQLIYQGDTSVAKISGASGTSTRKDCLGQFEATTATSGISTINVKVVAWYEGDDPNVVKGADLANVAADLKFYVKGDSTPAA